MASRRNRLGWLITLALAVGAPLVLWSGPHAGAAVGDVHGNELVYGRDVWPGQKPSNITVDNGGSGNAAVTIRNLRGQVVRTMSVPPECFFDWCQADPGAYDGYAVEWDGTNNSGAVVTAARYTGTARFVDRAGGTHTVSLGSLWVNRLVTRTAGGWQETWLDPDMDSLSIVGRCSSVLGPAPGTPWQIRLLSMNKCRSSAGRDDWAFRAQKLHFAEDDRASRVISVRLGATGSPVLSGDVATIVVDSSVGTAPSPTWRRVAELRRAGTQLGEVFTVPPGSMNHPQFDLLIQGRVVNGNRWRIQNWEASWTYRAWTR